jgi:hypothetical protein
MSDYGEMSVTSDAEALVVPEDVAHCRGRLLKKAGSIALVTALLLSVVAFSWGGHAGTAGLRQGGNEQLAATILQEVHNHSVPEYGVEWQGVISGTSCGATQLTTKSGRHHGSLTCNRTGDVRHFRFPVGMFDIDQQVVVPASTIIEGAANPNDPSDKTRKPDPSTQTFFIATSGVSDPNAAYCGSNGNMAQGDAQNMRIGFLLNSNTVVKNINFQGKDTVRPNDNGNLCGGGVFETPGCVSPGFGDGVGFGWESKRGGCYDHTGKYNELLLGSGGSGGVANVFIENVRLNDLYLPSDPSQYASGQASQVAVWTPMTNDGSAVTNITVRNLVSMLTRGDGINFHGNVQNSLVEDCHIENTGDDNYAFWGAYAENPSGVVFRNNVAVNPGVTRDYGYGVCAAIYGAKGVEITGLTCYDLSNQAWKKQANANGCMAYVHDGWFGAIYPPGCQINIHDNQYFYMDQPTTPIPASDRPMIRNDPHPR